MQTSARSNSMGNKDIISENTTKEEKEEKVEVASLDVEALQRENADLRAAATRNAERARRAARLRGLTARLAASLDRNAIFGDIIRAACDLCDTGSAALLLVEEETGTLRVETSEGLQSPDGTLLRHEVTVAGRALETREAIAVDDTSGEARTVFLALDGGGRPGALIAAPIRVEGRSFGVIEVYYRDPRPIPQEDVDLLDILSDAAAIALRNAIAYTRILEQGAELAQGNEELARQKEELNRLNVELRRANVLKSQFLSTMSHELRTPLTSIIGFSSILLRDRKGEKLTDRQRDNAERILSSARHLVTLINDILDLSRIEAGRLDVFRREVDLYDLLDTLRREMEPQALAKRLSFSVETGPELGNVVTDADRLRQILVNLIGNAIKFTHLGGVTIRASRTADAILIAVEDTGIGIPPGEAEHVFDEFYQSDQSSTRAASGTGLGLAISRRLAGLLDGRLTVQSTPGEGSVFTVVLPAVRGAHAVAGPMPPRQETGVIGKARLLVIDDDPDVVLLLDRALEGSPYTVIGALSSDEGLRKAHELAPTAILLDVMMPETDGWRTLHRLKADPETAPIPVIMHTIVADQALGFSLGATDYLVKPVEREQLLASLGRLTPVSNGPILIVDDDENIRTLLAHMLSDEQIATRQAASGEEALRLVQERAPRLVLLDLMMPGMDGFTVLQRLRADVRTRFIPVIVVTAKTLTPEEEEMLRREASTVVMKNSVPLERLLDDIRTAVAEV